MTARILSQHTRSLKCLLLSGAAILAMAGSEARAETTITATSPYWVAEEFTAGNKTYCTVKTTLGNGRVFSIVTNTGNETLSLFAYNPGWNTSDPGIFTNMTFKIDNLAPWHGPQNAFALGHSVRTSLQTNGLGQFVHEFTAGGFMQITIDGVNQGWQLNLTGTTAVWAAFMRCAELEAPQVVAALTSPGAMPTQPVAPPPSTVIGEARIGKGDNGGLDTVSVALNGRPYVFELDSGATSVVIPRRIAKQLAADGTLTAADRMEDTTVILANGAQHRAFAYMMKSVTVAGITVRDVRCVVGDDNTSLLLGQSFLRRFKSWSIDNDRHVLILGTAA